MEALEKLISTGSLWLADSASSTTARQHPLKTRNQKERLLSNLRDQLPHSSISRKTVPFDLGKVDSAFIEGGLKSGSIHEWFSAIETPLTNKHFTHPPFSLLSHLARQALKNLGEDKFIVWIGKDCWPTAFILQLCSEKDGSEEESDLLLKRSLFFRTKSNLEKLWAIDLALRSRASAAVICQTYDMPFALTKKLAMAAQQGGGLGLFVRPASELQGDNTPASVATTKWLIAPVRSSQDTPSWSLKLLKKKGVQARAQEWILNSSFKNHTKLQLHAKFPQQTSTELRKRLA